MSAISSKRKMLSPLVSWILSSPSSSSSSTSSDEEASVDINSDDGDYDQNDNGDDDSDHFFSSSDGGGAIPVALAVPDASPAVTVAFAAADDADTSIPNGYTDIVTTTIATGPKRQRTNYSGSGRQYQRLWTKQDEIELLKGYLDYIKQHRWATTSLQNDVALLYDHIRPKLNTGFNKNQLVEKLRRLKRKHKNALDKINSASGKEVSFRSPQEKAIFEISRKIWGNDRDQEALDDDVTRPIPSNHDVCNIKVKTEAADDGYEMENRVLGTRKRQLTDDVDRTNDQNNSDANTSIEGLIEETMRSCFSPLLKELFENAPEEPLGGLAPNPIPLLSGEQSVMKFGSGEAGDEQWRKRRILELEVYLKRLELLQNQIKARLEELRSS